MIDSVELVKIISTQTMISCSARIQALAWRIELDNRQRWENPLMGWTSSGDPLSNISMNLKFASKEDAIDFCVKNRWTYEVEKEHERKILPKNYASNFAWNKKTRVSTK
ncbi:ETC complex I subunit region [Ostertagia ostertagi]